METTPLKIKIIIGSVREKRFATHPAAWIATLAATNPTWAIETLDLLDYPLPFYTNAQSPKALKQQYDNPTVKKWADKIDEADGFIVIAPEYDHSIPAVLKNAFDHVFYEWHNKPIAFVAYGTVGGARSVEHLRAMAIELGLAPIRNAVHIFSPWTLTDENKELKPGSLDSYTKAGEEMLEQLNWWTKTLKAGRESKT